MHTFFGVLAGRQLAEDRAYSQQHERLSAVARIQSAYPLQSTPLKARRTIMLGFCTARFRTILDWALNQTRLQVPAH